MHVCTLLGHLGLPRVLPREGSFWPQNSHNYSTVLMLMLKWPQKRSIGLILVGSMFNISRVHAQIVFGSVLDHFPPFGQFLALSGGQNGCFGVKSPLSRGVPEQDLNGPKVCKHAWYHCFISIEVVWWWYYHFGATLRLLCYFLPVAIFLAKKGAIFKPPLHQIGAWRRL